MNTKKDWSGNSKTTYATIGASNHVEEEREENDFYATDPIAAEWLLKLEELDRFILEPSFGQGHLAKVFSTAGHEVKAYDLIDRGYGEVKNFFDVKEWNGDVVTNPPYSFGQEFIEHAIGIIPTGQLVCMFMKTVFVEGQKRRGMFEKYPPIRIWQSSKRINCSKNGDFTNPKTGKKNSSAIAYAWYVWQKGFTGNTTLKWFN